MNKKFFLWCFLALTLLLLGACSSDDKSDLNTSTTGSVSITTDHSHYAATDQIKVQVINHQKTAIYALDTQASCSILGLETQRDGKWEISPVAHCLQKRQAAVEKIDVGKTYLTTIQAGSSGSKKAAFPAGTYRFSLTYATSASQAGPLNKNSQTIYSTTFVVSGSSVASINSIQLT